MCLVNNISVTLNISVEVKVSKLSVQTEIRLPKVQIAFFYRRSKNADHYFHSISH